MTRRDERVPQRSLQCMEIWSGNSAAERQVATPGLDIWVHSRPFERATSGGDVHYVSLCGAGFITRIVLADVSGHGEDVADFGRRLRDLMRRNMNRKSQARLIAGLNRQFLDLAQMRRFATAVVATYLTTGDKLTLCNAGHPRPLWYRADAREWVVLESREGDGLANLPLGIDGSTAYPQVDLVLGRGDLVLVYTDALTEAAGADGRQLGEAGLLELARGLDVSDPGRVAGQLLDAIERFRGGKPADDDQTFLLLHHNAGSPPRQTLRESLDVYAKVLGLKRV